MCTNIKLIFFASFVSLAFSHITLANSQKAEQFYIKALNQYDAGDLYKSDKNIRKAIDEDRQNAKYHRLLGDINYRKEAWPIAISEYHICLELDTNYTDLYYKLAKAYLYSRKFNECFDYYKKYLNIYETDTTAWKEITDIYEASGNILETNFCYNMLTELGVVNKVNQRRTQYIDGHLDLDSSIANAIMAGTALIGMTAEQIKASIGEATDINRTVLDWGVKEQWVYGSPPQIFLYLEDGILKSFQD